jgi:hypothetical protein
LLESRQLFSAGAQLDVPLLAGTRIPAAEIDPHDFVRRVTNPYFPLNPLTTYIYKGRSDGHRARNVTTVTNATKEILGVITTVVRDRAYIDGNLVEETLDWYAQDRQGNVWYFGEDSKDIRDGKVVSTEGSWQAGVDGAEAGIIMKAAPKVGDAYAQESAPGVAEDQAQVLAFRQRATTPFGTFFNCLQTREFTPLEPDVSEHKFYVAGIGLVRAVMVEGGDDVMKLAAIRYWNV